MNDMLDTGYEENMPKKRPVFITVLCILTFVSCGLSFISALWRLAFGNDTKQSIEAMRSMQRFGDSTFDKMADSLEKLQEWQVTADFLALGNVALCLAGALLMWKLKKSGFFIYVGGQVLPFISLFGMYSVVQDVPFMGISFLIVSIVAAIFAIAFIIMYGINLKHMR